MSAGLTNSVVIPYVEEKAVYSAATASTAPNAIIVDVPCIHAKRIDVVIRSTVALAAVNIIFSAASDTLNWTVNLGAVGAATTAPFTYTTDVSVSTEAIGDTYVIQATAAAAGAGTINCWTAARS
jgi:hypothetical protein|tara:strand:+ start:109 stop:483 length:375 start_codon:yes stop_codon:yes gene_type:complete